MQIFNPQTLPAFLPVGISTHFPAKKQAFGKSVLKASERDTLTVLFGARKNNPDLVELKALLQELSHIQSISDLLVWDQQVNLPDGGANARAGQLEFIAGLRHAKMTAPKVGELLSRLREPVALSGMARRDQALVREFRQDYERATKLPEEFVKKTARLGATGYETWKDAREKQDFPKFAPVLKELVAMARQKAEYLGYEENPYDALLDLYEPGMTVKQLDPLFEKMKQELIPLVKAIQASPKKPDMGFMKRRYGEAGQMTLNRKIARLMGFNFKRGRIDKAVHPFTTSMPSPEDVRWTLRFKPDDPFDAISSTTHETGHALYEQGVDPKLAGTGLGTGTSLGIHESQSRLWENLVGRSRAFWQFFTPHLKKVFPKEFAKYDTEAIYRAVNNSKPSFIRVEADEVTYNLHIIVRYEIEKDLINGKLAVEDVPKVWNRKMQEYFGITPVNDAEGCLQDVHWSDGSLGYFPTYTLGNLYASQFFKKAKEELPNLETQISDGKFLPLRDWLKKKIHRVGRMETPDQIVKRVTGEPLNAQYFVDYLWEKFGELYDIQRPAAQSQSQSL